MVSYPAPIVAEIEEVVNEWNGVRQMEQVLGLPRRQLQGYLPRRNILKGYVGEVLALSAREGEYRSRSEVEKDDSFKQLIPYIFLTSDRGIFLYRRMTGGGEERLHNLVSMGVGGHVNQMHEDPEVNWRMNMTREIHEELYLRSPYSLHEYGVLNEDETEVCRVHLGIVYEARIHDPGGVAVRESHELEGDWHPLSDLPALHEHMEQWSKILYESFPEVRG